MGIMWIFGIAFIVLILYLVKPELFRELHQSVGSKETALDILKRRYAKGEMSKEEFEEKKRDILD